MRSLLRLPVVVVVVLFLAGACEGQDAVRVPVPLLVDGTGAHEATTAEGWAVTLDVARLGVADVRFRAGGEQHASWLTPLSRLLLPSAHAHPGHTVGGDVVGEALGSYALDFVAADGEVFAEASALVTDANALDFTFAPLPAGDEETRAGAALFAGTARRAGDEVRFEAVIVQDEGRAVQGIGLTLDLSSAEEATVALGLRLASDAGETLFDGVDFSRLPLEEGVARIAPGSSEHNRVRNALQSHEHYRTTADPGADG